MSSALGEIIGEGVVWDNHACMPLRPGDDSHLPMLERCHATGVDVMSLNVGYGHSGIADHIGMLASFRRWVAERPNEYLLVRTAKDALEAKASGRLGLCFDIEGMQALEGRLDLIATYYDLGVRWMLTAYNRANEAGGGCMDTEDEGLTPLGREIVKEMNRVGMVPDAAHTGYRTAREMMELSSVPVIFSHANPRAMWDHPRNIPDDLMIACARGGGVVGLNGIHRFLGEDVTVGTFVEHIEYSLDLIGDDHVGIGLDYVFDQAELAEHHKTKPDLFPTQFGFDGTTKIIEPWCLGDVAEALVARGHSTSTLAKLFGGNHLRIAESVWH